MTELETERLILRPWRESDAADMYFFARDPDIGYPAGWPAHKSESESREIIKTVMNGPLCFAICLKESGRAVGAIELKLKGKTDLTDRDDECELGYWIGKPYWGRGLMPEAARALLRYAFTKGGMCAVWCGYYEGNVKSKRVQEKCGFKYVRTTPDVDVPLLGEKRTGHVNRITKEEWIKQEREKSNV